MLDEGYEKNSNDDQKKAEGNENPVIAFFRALPARFSHDADVKLPPKSVQRRNTINFSSTSGFLTKLRSASFGRREAPSQAGISEDEPCGLPTLSEDHAADASAPPSTYPTPANPLPSGNAISPPRQTRSLSLVDGFENEETPNVIGTSKILSTSHFQAIQNAVPARYRWDSFTLLYDLDAHGESVNTFFTRCRDKGQTILVCLTDKDEILGGFASESWQSTAKYYGTGETFVFTFSPRFVKYRWSRKNNFFLSSSTSDVAVPEAVCAESFVRDHLGYGSSASVVAFGGGSGYALSLNERFREGTSSACETFDSPPLLGESRRIFTVARLEVWGFAYEFAGNDHVPEPVIPKAGEIYDLY